MIEKISTEVFKPITNALDEIAADIEKEIVNFTTKVTAEADIVVMEVLSVSPLVKIVLILLALILLISLCKLCFESYYSIVYMHQHRHVRLQTDIDLGETLVDLGETVAGGGYPPTVPIIVVVPIERGFSLSENSALSRILKNVPASLKQTAITMPGVVKSKATCV